MLFCMIISSLVSAGCAGLRSLSSCFGRQQLQQQREGAETEAESFEAVTQMETKKSSFRSALGRLFERKSRCTVQVGIYSTVVKCCVVPGCRDRL